MNFPTDLAEGNPKILVAEDSPTQAEQLKHLLKQHNYEVLVAKDGHEALALMKEHWPALVISDIVMPEMDGYQLCHRIKSSQGTKDIPVILLTSLSNSEDVLDALECGADYFITKPYSESYLLSSMERIFENRKLRNKDSLRVGTEIVIARKSRVVKADQQQTLSLLISTYEAAVLTNAELKQTQNELMSLNARLEDLVEERTAALSQEVKERKQAELLQRLAREVLDRLNRSTDAQDTIRDILRLIQESTGLEALAIRLREGGDFPYYETNGFSEDFVCDRRHLRAWDEAGESRLDEAGNPVLGCLCGNVLRGLADAGRPFFTRNGSFWTNSLPDLQASARGEEQPVFIRNLCGDSGYQSVALIPLRSGDQEIIGLLQLNDRRPDRFTPEMIGFLEDLSSSIGLALFRQRSEERIRHLNRVLRAIRSVNELMVREKDPERLVQEACDLLVEHRGYKGAFIILVNEKGEPGLQAKAPHVEAFQAAPESFPQGILPPCCEGARLRDGIYHVTALAAMCAPCPMAAGCPKADVTCARLKHDQKTYGYLAVSMDHFMAVDAENQSLFAEMAADVASALHNIEQGKALERAEKARKLVEAELRQAQKMEAVGRLAGGVAHDFNNQLSVILGYSEMALSLLPPTDPLYGGLQEIRKATLRSADLTRQLLTFSRRQIVAPKVIDLNQAISDQQKMLARLIGENIEVKFIPAGDLWKIFIDPTQIHQILANLTVNSRDAIADVGTITIETSNIFLDEAYCRNHPKAAPGEYVMFSFSDTGAGMEAEVMEHLFEPFFTTKVEGKGTGLGLATVFGIVQQNDGVIHVYSEPGLGTTFKIYFPRFRGEADAPDRTVEEAPVRGTETVLIVEDEVQVLALAKTVLSKYGYDVLAAKTPGEAIQLVENHQGEIHLLLTDVVMPEMNGRELQVKILTIKPGLKTLFMSGYTANAITHRGVIEKGLVLISKPFTINSLARKVREVLDQDCPK